jgi:hypothetical protein
MADKVIAGEAFNEAETQTASMMGKSLKLLVEHKRHGTPAAVQQAMSVLSDHGRHPSTMRTRRQKKAPVLVRCTGPIYFDSGLIVAGTRQPFRRVEPASLSQPVQFKPKSFYSTEEWKRLRYQIIKERGPRCECCGATPQDGRTTIRVDHIKPLSQAWHLRLDPSNLQVLCNDCNWGKGGQDDTDWRQLA